MPPVIDRDLCRGCGTCEDICPGDIIRITDDQPELIYPDECFHCGACLLDCPEDAITIRIPLHMMLPAYEQNFFEKR
ncbi:MAG: ferredoxin family protein [Deltaproteobacteria bacterium]|nr:ferredoxin family protein [Deltaproteobacteria bacterium]